MRILFLLPDVPYPPTTGGRLKVFNVLKILSKHHECDLLCFTSDREMDHSKIAEILPNVKMLGVYAVSRGMDKVLSMVWMLFRGRPLSFASFSGKQFKKKFESLLVDGQYDLIHYDIVNMAQFGSWGKIPSVHSPNDATSMAYASMAEKTVSPIEKMRWLLGSYLLKRFEKKVYPLFTKVHVVSEADADYLRALNPAIDVSSIPIATSADYLSIGHLYKYKLENEHPFFQIIFTGNLGNHAIAKGLQDFLDEALPTITSNIPNIQVVVLGQNISLELEHQISISPHMKLQRWVDDYRSFLLSADVVFIPDSVGPPGAKTRTVQAMGLGLTVVGSEAAFSGMSFKHLEHGLMYKTMPECAELMLHLYKNPAYAQELGENAHRLIEAEFAFNAVGPLYETLYRDAKKYFKPSTSLLNMKSERS